LYSRYWRAARAAAFGVTGEFASAEDAAAEAFKHALVGIGSLRDPNRFGSWLRTIAVRKARLGLRRRDPAPGASADLSDSSEGPDDALERLEMAALIERAVRELPHRWREAIALVYFEGYDPDAAARFLGIPAGTLRRRLHDGRGRLRRVVGHILLGSTRMKEEREHRIQEFETVIESGETYGAFRGALALRPPAHGLIRTLLQTMARTRDSQAVAPREESSGIIAEMVRRLLDPSDRAADTNHPVGSIAAAIRRALPDFQNWPRNDGGAAMRFLTFASGQGRPQTVLPPGFAEGRPGAFLRVTRAILRPSANGTALSIYEVLQDSPDEQAFRIALCDARISDVLDLSWMVAGPLELRSVQELLERLSSRILPEVRMRFSTYDEPRYRAALQLHIGDAPERAACGGVLAEWPGCPGGVGVAHLRIFLEPWATVQSGQAVEFAALPW
jgi:RNA polymerase sigma factor (sigma-70 family)